MIFWSDSYFPHIYDFKLTLKEVKKLKSSLYYLRARCKNINIDEPWAYLKDLEESINKHLKENSDSKMKHIGKHPQIDLDRKKKMSEEKNSEKKKIKNALKEIKDQNKRQKSPFKTREEKREEKLNKFVDDKIAEEITEDE